MRVYVTGATGVIGRRVVPMLLAHGHSVTAAARSPPVHEITGVRFAPIDLFDVGALTRAFAGHDAVVNLATHMPSATWKMLFRRAWRLNDRIRREGSANVAAAAESCGIRTLIQESFALTYPDRGDAWIDERTDLDPGGYNSTVLDAEKAVARFTERGGNGVVLRYAAFYGPDAMQIHSYIKSLRMGWAALPGGPEAYISSVCHDDAAAAVVAALNLRAGAYNVVDDEPVWRAVYFGSLATDLGLAPPRFLPNWMTSLLGSVGETMARSLRLSNRKLRGATDWAPRLPNVRDGWPVMLAQMPRRVARRNWQVPPTTP
jgi:2-alkyl-3-oxoalkanoate reductase